MILIQESPGALACCFDNQGRSENILQALNSPSAPKEKVASKASKR